MTNFLQYCDIIDKLDDDEKKKIYHIIQYINSFKEYDEKLNKETDKEKKTYYENKKEYYKDLTIINYDYYLKSKKRSRFDPPDSPPPQESPPPSPPPSPINAEVFSPVTSPEKSENPTNKRGKCKDTLENKGNKKIKVMMPDLK
tara:strand:- start:407 stop:838 length:432 start_codon:yes stop_codon:yes gene_type:complete